MSGVCSSTAAGRSSSSILMSSVAYNCGDGPSDGAIVARSSSCTRGSRKGSAMKMTSKPNPSHQYIDIVSSTGRISFGMMYVRAP